MKNILAIDTSASYLSLALEANNQVYYFVDKVDNKQSQHIIPQIDALCNEAKIKIDQIDHIAYNQGPGSFTGLRIGLSVAMGIAFGITAQLIPIPAFAIYALQAYRHFNCKQVLVGIDARLNQVYLAGLTMPEGKYFLEPELVDPKDIPINFNIPVIGSGFLEYAKQISSGGEPLDLEYPDARYMLELVKIGNFVAISPSQADLLYLRNKVALNLNEQQEQNAHKISTSI